MPRWAHLRPALKNAAGYVLREASTSDVSSERTDGALAGQGRAGQGIETDVLEEDCLLVCSPGASLPAISEDRSSSDCAMKVGRDR
jgi:hypothetical protein